jgi:alcohol dehydrogenase class IV
MVVIVNAMAHSIGAVAHLQHGIANGILLADCMEFNLEASEEGYAMIAETIGAREKGMDDTDAAKAAITAIRDFTRRISHPQKLSVFSVKIADIQKAADMSLSDGAIVNNPRFVMDSSEVLGIFEKTF